MGNPMENKQQTAVEWLVEQIEAHKIEIIYSDKIDSIKCLPSIVAQAKAMEKEQIIDSFDEARTYVLKNVWKHDDGIRYYENKYGEDPNRS
jgi:hypothetical protein